jgi:hypothetical protein
MNFVLDEMQIAVRDATERLLGDLRRRKASAEIAWNALAGEGWLSFPVPENCGGAGATLFDIGMLMRAAGRNALITPFFSSSVSGSLLVRHLPNSAFAASVMADTAAGSVRVAFAHQEGTDYDPARLTTTACQKDGNWVVSGAKQSSLGADDADWLFVSARTPDGTGVFLLEKARDGVELSRVRTLRGEDAADIVIRSVALDHARCLGCGRDVAAALSKTVDELVLCLCWEAVGAMEDLLQQTIGYVKLREQFAKPLASLQTVQHRIAEMAVRCEEARSMTELATLRAQEAGQRRLVSAAKVQVARNAKFVAEAAVQLHGAAGFTQELAVSRYFHLLTSFQHLYGTVENHLLAYADAALPSRKHLTSAVLS